MRRAAALAFVVMFLVARSEDPARGAQTRTSRIVSLVPAVTEMLFAIGAGDQVVGVSSFDRYPPEAATRPRLGALIDPDVERLLSLRPDLAVVYGTQSDLLARLTRAGVPMFTYEHAGLSNITQTIRLVGARVGHEAAANRLATEIETGIADIRRRFEGRPRPRVALVIGREPDALRGIFASGGVGFMHDMLEAAGGVNVFADVGRQSLQVSAELLLAREPEVILETHPPEGWTPSRVTRERQLWRALPGLPAVRDDRIHILTNEVVLVPGPRVVEGIRLMAAALHTVRSAPGAMGCAWVPGAGCD